MTEILVSPLLESHILAFALPLGPFPFTTICNSKYNRKLPLHLFLASKVKAPACCEDWRGSPGPGGGGTGYGRHPSIELHMPVSAGPLHKCIQLLRPVSHPVHAPSPNPSGCDQGPETTRPRIVREFLLNLVSSNPRISSLLTGSLPTNPYRFRPPFSLTGSLLIHLPVLPL